MRCAVLLVLVGACAIDEPDVGPPLAGNCEPADSDPEVDVRFSLDIRPMMNRPRGEADCSCHQPSAGPNNPSGIELGGLDLGSVEKLRRGGRVSGADLVVPGDPCASILMHKIADTPAFGSRMPLDGPPYLTPEEVQLVSDWIAEGANDN